MHWLCKSLFVLFMAFAVVMPGYADVDSATQLVDELKTQINDNTDSGIIELYQDLTNALAEYKKADKTSNDGLKANAQVMKERENSMANKLLGAAGIGTVGIGGMQMASALAEQSADDDADRDMRAYLATFRCDYGQGRNIVGGETDILLPGASDLAEYVAEYRTLALNLQADKAALGVLPGIESELVLDSATMNLYNNVNIGTQKGAFTSLSRALMDENSADATELAEQRQGTKDKLKTGTALAVGGAVATVAANLLIDSSAGAKLHKNNLAENVEYEETKYEKMPLDERIIALESDLRALIQENERLMNKYNEDLRQHKEYVKSIVSSTCLNEMKSYIERINELVLLSDKLQHIPVIGYDLDDVKEKHAQCKLISLEGPAPIEDTVKGYGIKNACHPSNKDKPGMKCVKGVFNWINVNMIQAVRIAKEYVRAVDGDTVTQCNNMWVDSYNDNYVLCKTAKGVNYSFQFDDVTESVSNTIRNHSAKAICEGVYKGQYEGPSALSVSGEEGLPKQAVCRFKNNSNANCNELRKSLKYFDFTVLNTNNPNTCFIYFTPYSAYVRSKNTPVYGKRKYVENNQYPNVDSFEFRKMGLQMRGEIAVVDMIRYWLSFKTGKSVSDIYCNDGTVAYYGSDVIGNDDDILGCYIAGKRVDLVFDDFSENFNDHTKQALQAGVCMVNDGVYTGRSCIGAATNMTKEKCDAIKESFRTSCPNCYPPKWENGICTTLENAEFVGFFEKYGAAAGVAVTSVALAIPSGGASLGAAVVGLTATAVSIGTDYYITSDVLDFINKTSSQCRNAECTVDGKATTVEAILEKYLTRMLSLKGSVSAAQAVALDKELARLLGLVSKKSPLYKKLQQGGSSWGTTELVIKNIAGIVGVVAAVISMGISAYQGADFLQTKEILKSISGTSGDAYSVISGVT